MGTRQAAKYQVVDERGLVSSLFVWAIAVFLVIGLTLNDVGQCIVAKSEASNAAQAASDPVTILVAPPSDYQPPAVQVTTPAAMVRSADGSI